MRRHATKALIDLRVAHNAGLGIDYLGLGSAKPNDGPIFLPE